jgi:o-succinylbenzoate synthase
VTLRLREFRLDLASPLRTARGDVTERRGLLVAAEGGVGEATPLPGWTESFETCRERLEAVARDGDPLDASLDATDAPAARHGLSLARLDGAAREAGVSLASHLAAGAPARSVPVNATVGDGSPRETAAAAERAVEAGFDCLKVKVGAGSVERDVARLRAVRDRVGHEPLLRADANGAWERQTARAALEAFESLDVAYVEQPLDAADLAGHRALREVGVPVALDESLATHSLARVLEVEAADVLVLKPMALGGPDRTVRAARSARARGVSVTVTTTVDAVVARTAAVHAAAAIPDVRHCGLATADRLAADLAPDPAPVADGHAPVPSGPGLAGDAFDGLV